MLLATAEGNPGPVAAPVTWSAHLIGQADREGHLRGDRRAPHTARKPVWIAAYGALTGPSALAALFPGILLAG
jgi:hypothetical protein